MSANKPEPQGVIQSMIDYLLDQDYAGYDATVLRGLKVASASYEPIPCATLRMIITPNLCNKMGNLHGGATATIFDNCTTFPIYLAREEGSWEMPGVSRTLNVAYLAAVKEGEEVEVEAEIVSIGKRLGRCHCALLVQDG